MPARVKIGYHPLPLVETNTSVFFRKALAQLEAKRVGGRIPPLAEEGREIASAGEG